MCAATCGNLNKEEVCYKHTFKWKIPNFLDRPEEHHQHVWSPILTVKNTNDKPVNIALSIYPKGHSGFAEYVSLYLCNQSNISLNLKSSVSIKDNTKKHSPWSENCDQFTLREKGHKEDSRGFPKFIHKNVLKENSNALLTNGSLTILLDVFICVSEWNDTSKTLADDFTKAFEHKEFSDIKILCHGEEFYCHRIILAIRSPVFNAMVNTNFKEGMRKEVNLDSMKPEILKEMLMFIYCGRLENLKNSALELLEAADQYQLNDLKEICGHHLGNNLTKENVLDYLILADRHYQIYLKDKAMSFIANNIKSLMGTSEWEGLGEKLLVEIMQVVVKERID